MKDDDNRIAYCGLYCGACGIYLATATDRLEEVAEQTGIPVEYQGCTGCRTDRNNLCCMNCGIKRCCLYKGLGSCAECDEFPCSVLEAFDKDRHPHHTGVIGSLQLLAGSGQEQWLNIHQQRWCCPQCATPFHWYQEHCESCGKEVKGYKLQDS